MTQETKRRSWFVVAAVASLLAFCGCGVGDSTIAKPSVASQSQVATTSDVPDTHRFMRMRWSDVGAVDLGSSTGTFIRAIYESAQWHRMAYHAVDTFPGYEDANRDPKRQGYGTTTSDTFEVHDERAKILRVDDLGGGLKKARVCVTGRVQAGSSALPPLISSDSPPTEYERSPGIVLITFQTGGEEPLDDQRGSATRPVRNVFGDWYMTSLDYTWGKGEQVEVDARAECGDMGDLTAPGQSYPGWPGSGV